MTPTEHEAAAITRKQMLKDAEILDILRHEVLLGAKKANAMRRAALYARALAKGDAWLLAAPDHVIESIYSRDGAASIWCHQEPESIKQPTLLAALLALPDPTADGTPAKEEQ